jgi:hypothetical protein
MADEREVILMEAFGMPMYVALKLITSVALLGMLLNV